MKNLSKIFGIIALSLLISGCSTVKLWVCGEPEVQYITKYIERPDTITKPDTRLLQKCDPALPLLKDGKRTSILNWRANVGEQYLKCANNNNKLVESLTEEKEK